MLVSVELTSWEVYVWLYSLFTRWVSMYIGSVQLT